MKQSINEQKINAAKNAALFLCQKKYENNPHIQLVMDKIHTPNQIERFHRFIL